jgi:hypothetical protein
MYSSTGRPGSLAFSFLRGEMRDEMNQKPIRTGIVVKTPKKVLVQNPP